MTAVALYGAGVRVKIPQPERYAAHKLIVAAQPERDRAKRRKDLVQAAELIEALAIDDPARLDMAMADAAGRGPKWTAAIASSLAALSAEPGRATQPIAALKEKFSAPPPSRRAAPAKKAAKTQTAKRARAT